MEPNRRRLTPEESARLQQFVRDRHRPRHGVRGAPDPRGAAAARPPQQEEETADLSNVGLYLGIAGHLCPSSSSEFGDRDHDLTLLPDWTPPRPKKQGLDGGGGEGSGESPSSKVTTWHDLAPEDRPIPICYGIDWTRNHANPESKFRLRHPVTGGVLPWLARYPGAGFRLCHPVPVLEDNWASDCLDHFVWPRDREHRFRTDGSSREAFENNFPKYQRKEDKTQPEALRFFLRQVEVHCRSWSVYFPPKETLRADEQMGTRWHSLPVHVQSEVADQFDFILYMAFSRDETLRAEFGHAFDCHTHSGYEINYELAVEAMLPMLSMAGFEATRTPPNMNDRDTITKYTSRWLFWLIDNAYLGWAYSDRWFLYKFALGLHPSLGRFGRDLQVQAERDCTNQDSAYSSDYAPAKLGRTFESLVSGNLRGRDVSYMSAVELAAVLRGEALPAPTIGEVHLSEGPDVVAVIEPAAPGRRHPHIRYQKKIDEKGRARCNMCGSLDHNVADCRLRPNPAIPLSVALYKQYWKEVDPTREGAESYYEFVRRVALDLSPDYA